MVLNKSIISKEGHAERYRGFPSKKQFTFKSIRCTHTWGGCVIFRNWHGSPHRAQGQAGVQWYCPHSAHLDVRAAGDLPGPSRLSTAQA